MEQMKVHVLAPESVEECEIMIEALYVYMLQAKEVGNVWKVQKSQQIIDVLDKMKQRIERSANWVMKRKMRKKDEMVIMKDGKATIVSKDDYEDQLDSAYISKQFDVMEKEQTRELKAKETEIKKIAMEAQKKETKMKNDMAKMEERTKNREAKLEDKLKDVSIKYEIEKEKLKEAKRTTTKKVKAAVKEVKEREIVPVVSDDEIVIPDINIVGDVYEGE